MSIRNKMLILLSVFMLLACKQDRRMQPSTGAQSTAFPSNSGCKQTALALALETRSLLAGTTVQPIYTGGLDAKTAVNLLST